MEKPPPNLVEDSKKPNNKGVSLIAFVLSILIYISIFYIFKLSPSTDLLNNTKFWFFISNTLILIIAADYSSSKEKQADLYEEYVTETQVKTVSSFVSQYQKEEIAEDQIVIKKPTDEDLQERRPFVPTKVEKIQKRSNKFGKAKRVVIDESKNTVRMLETEKNYKPASINEENEFTSMSDEELNRRVEEFILRFNRQIRLQAAARN